MRYFALPKLSSLRTFGQKHTMVNFRLAFHALLKDNNNILLQPLSAVSTSSHHRPLLTSSSSYKDIMLELEENYVFCNHHDDMELDGDETLASLDELDLYESDDQLYHTPREGTRMEDIE